MWLTWQQALWLGGVCAVVFALSRPIGSSTSPARAVAVVRGGRLVIGEVAIMAVLYALWQYVFALTVTRTAGAMDHARSIYDFEQRVGLPDEKTIQEWSMHSRTVIQGLNTFYAYVHIPALGIMLVWLFFRHRDRYPRIRNTLAISTGACLAIQSIPVAPPRFFPQLGFVDTGLLYGQSVYGEGGSGISNQLAAMPSVHVLWSVLVAFAFVTASTSAWRWITVLHPTLTVWAVVATGNHWWADGIVAVGLLAASWWLLEGISAVARRVRPHAREPDRGDHDRAPEQIEPAVTSST